MLIKGIDFSPSATQKIAIGFLFIIAIGTFLLMLPAASANHTATGLTDALFTATSAVCITGLTTVTTCSHWSFFGQIVIILLIQTGGLGIMTLVAVVFFIFGKKITLRERMMLSESLNIEQKNSITRYVQYIVVFTFVAELIGACVLSLRFVPLFGLKRGIYYSLFHSVSAFCNAGFDILGDDSLCAYYNDGIINTAVIALIVVSGLGFPVWSDIYVMLKNIIVKKMPVKHCVRALRLHSKIVLTATAILILTGWAAFTFFEWDNPATMGGMAAADRPIAGLFQSVTLRTAGFATVDQAKLTSRSKFLSVLLMFAGGSPAGTAGGVKTATMAVIFFSIKSVVKGRKDIVAFNRTISFATLQKALSITSLMFCVLCLSTMIICGTEDGIDFIDLLFESASALGTVGVTAGVTTRLTTIGRLIIIFCMFIGRLGPITIVVALTKKSYIDGGYVYPESNVIVG